MSDFETQLSNRSVFIMSNRSVSISVNRRGREMQGDNVYQTPSCHTISRLWLKGPMRYTGYSTTPTNVFYRKNLLAPLIVLCARSCAKSCALGLVRMSCAYVLCGFKNDCEPQTSCARCCADVVRVLCVVFGGDCGFGTFFRVVLCASCAGVLGGRSRHLGRPTHFT